MEQAVTPAGMQRLRRAVGSRIGIFAIVALLLSILCAAIITTAFLWARSSAEHGRRRAESVALAAMTRVAQEGFFTTVDAARYLQGVVHGVVLVARSSEYALMRQKFKRAAALMFGSSGPVMAVAVESMDGGIRLAAGLHPCLLKSLIQRRPRICRPEGPPRERSTPSQRARTVPQPIAPFTHARPNVGHLLQPYFLELHCPHKAEHLIGVANAVYDVSIGGIINATNPWGCVYAFMEGRSGTTTTAILREATNRSMQALIFARYDGGTNNVSEDHIVPLASTDTSLLNDDESDVSPQQELRLLQFIHRGLERPVLSTISAWRIAVYATDHISSARISHTVLLTLVASGVVGIVMFSIIAIIMSCCALRYDGRIYITDEPPFALLTIGPAKSHELWSMAADQMTSCVDQMNAMLVTKMQEHRSYQIPTQLLPNTSTYVFSTVESAVRMAFDVIEELQRNPVDERLRELLGEDERLLMTYAVHWCTDATVTEDKVEDALLYAGPDVAYAGRMWVFSSPNTVTLSEAAKSYHDEMCRDGRSLHTSWIINPLTSLYVTGVCERQRLYTIMDGQSALQGRSSRQAAVVLQKKFSEQLLTHTSATTAAVDAAGMSDLPSMLWRHPPAADEPTDLDDEWRGVLVGHSCDTWMEHGATTHVPLPDEADQHMHHGPGSSWADLVSNPSLDSVGHDPCMRFAPPNHHQREESEWHNSDRDEPTEEHRTHEVEWMPKDFSLRLDSSLRAAFERQALTLPTSYDSVRILVFYFYTSYKLLFKPLTAQERTNLQRRLATAFGVPQQEMVVQLAACCAARHLREQYASLWISLICCPPPDHA